MILVYEGLRQRLSSKLRRQLNLTRYEQTIYLPVILFELGQNTHINYDFEAIEYTRKRIKQLQQDRGGKEK